MPGSLEYGKAVGLDVEPSPAMALVRPLAHETKSKKRAAMPPMAVLLLENAACEPPPEYSEQLIEYTRHLYMMLVANTRAKNFHTWKLKETKPKDDLICLVFVGDDPKAKKLGVHQYVPAGGLARGPLLWQQSYAERLTGRAFTCADWLAPAKKKIDASTGWADGMAPNKKAMDGLKSAAAAALGVSEEFMREIGISGTHTGRHVGGTVTTILEWPEAEGCAIGGWAPPKDDAPSKRTRTSKATTSRASYAAPAASEGVQWRSRVRYFRAMRAAFSHYGTENVTWDTTWEDLFAYPLPTELTEFHGKDAGAGPGASAD